MTDEESIDIIRRLSPIINKGQADMRRIREDLGVKPGESLMEAMGLKKLMTYQEQKRIRVVAFHEGTQWVAQVLEHDLAVQEKNLSDLLHAISRITDAHVDICQRNGSEPWESLAKTPDMYEEKWEKAVFLRSWEQDTPKPVIHIRVL